MSMISKDNFERLSKFRWLIVTLLALLVASLFSLLSSLPFLIMALSLTVIGLIFAYRKGSWLILFILSNLPVLTTTLLSRERALTTTDSAVFFVIFLFSLSFSYYLARKIQIIPKVEWKYFSVPKTLTGFALIFFVSIATGLLAQVLHQTTSTANQEALNKLQTMIPVAVFATQSLAAGFFEELVYRVGIFEIIFKKHQKFAFVAAVLIFALMHSPTNLYSWLTYGLMSLVLTGIYAKYRNFYLNMSTHLLWNLFGLLITLLIK